MWLLQVQTSVYIPVWVFIVRFNASLWRIWENFLLGVGDMCARWGVKTQPCDGTAYSASHSPYLSGDWIPVSVRKLGVSKLTQELCLGDKRVWMDRLHNNICWLWYSWYNRHNKHGPLEKLQLLNPCNQQMFTDASNASRHMPCGIAESHS